MASSKLKNCKVCGAEIAKSAKVCPHCGAKNKRNTGWIGVVILAIVVLFVVTISNKGNELLQEDRIAASQARNEYSQKVADDLTNGSTTEKTTYGVGEKAVLNNIACSLVSITESKGSTYNKPEDGNVFLLCEFEIENNSKTEISVSSLISFQAYCDDYTCNYSLTAVMEKGNKNLLDGQVASGKKINGVVGYEIPVDWKELEIHFKPDYLSGKEFVFEAKH